MTRAGYNKIKAELDQLQNEHENENRGEESASGRDAQRAKNVVEQNFGAILDAAHTARPILRLLRLSGSHLDAHGKIGGRNVFGDTRQHDGELAEAFQFFAANVAGLEMLADLHALSDGRAADDSVVQITTKL